MTSGGSQPSDDDQVHGPIDTPFGELTFDDDHPPDLDRQRRNNRVLTLGIVIGAVVVLGLGVVGVVVVRHYLDARTSLTATMSSKYARTYRSCVEDGGDRSVCATSARAACAVDPGWSVQRNAAVRSREVADACRFGPDVGH